MRPIFRGLARAAVAVVLTGSLAAFATGTADAATASSHAAADPQAASIADQWRTGHDAVVTGEDGARYAARVVDGQVLVAKVSVASANRLAASDAPNSTCTKAFAVATVIFAIGSAVVLTLLAAAAIIGAPALIIGGITITVAGLTAASAALASWTAVMSQLEKLLC
ncbi:MAG TPA: hypothetical protein VJX66_01740 [Amycolatopsis sp.]|nr:hypothetical protein [Amycolatopsis sp.]